MEISQSFSLFLSNFSVPFRRDASSLVCEGNSCHFPKVSRDNFKHTTSLLLLALSGAFLSSVWRWRGLMGVWEYQKTVSYGSKSVHGNFQLSSKKKLERKTHGIDRHMWHHQRCIPSKKFPAKYLVAILFLTIYTAIKRIKRSGRALQSAVWSACKFHTSILGSQRWNTL